MHKPIKKNLFLLTLLLIFTSCGGSAGENPPSESTISDSTSSEISQPDVSEPISSEMISSEEEISSEYDSTVSSDEIVSSEEISISTSVHEHTFSEEYIYDETYHWYESTCGHEESEEKIKHTFESEVTDPTYEAGGFTTYTCTTCDYTYKDDKTDPLKHNYATELSYDEHSHWYACIDKGYENLKKDEQVHTFNKTVINPTYEEKGYTTYECKHCDYSYVGDETEVLKHNYATKLSYDEKTHWYACTDKGYENLKKGEATHTYNIVVTKPTYEAGGYTTYSCKSCAYTYKSDFTNALKHNYATGLSYDEHSHWYACIDKGYENLKKDEQNHDFNVLVTAPTHYEKGYTTYECKECEYSYKDDYKDVLRNKITYHLDGGVNSPNNPDSFTVEDEIYFLPPSKDGYAFLGWFDKNDNPVNGIDIGTTVDIEVYAKWADVFVIEGTKLVSVDGSYPIFQMDIPNGITTIGASAFAECEYLAAVIIPESITKIETDAFYGCSNLDFVIYEGTLDKWAQITFDDVTSNPMIYATSFNMINSNGEYYEVTDINLSDNVSEIKDYAFNFFANVTSLTISKNVTNINYCAFKHCTSLKTITFAANSSLKTIGESAFYGCSSLENVDLPYGLETIKPFAFQSCGELKSINLPETLKTIEEGAFKNNDELTSIRIPSGITKISEQTFIECVSLVSVELPSSLKTIEDFAFRYCSSLAKIDIPSGVTTIGMYAFSSCDELKSIRIPSSVTSIGIDAFEECSEGVIYCQSASKPSGWNTDWNPSYCTVYWGKASSDIYEKNGVEYIVYNSTGYVSSYLDTVENVVVEEKVNIKGTDYTVTTIGESAFASRYNMKTISLPSLITKIEGHAFSGSELEYIVIPSSVRTIGMDAFFLCYGLVIYCEATGAQSAWDAEWNPQNCTVYYKNSWEYDENGIPKPIN